MSESRDICLRPMRAPDLPAVHEVECAAHPHPWTLDILRDCLRVDYACWVGAAPDRLVAHGIMSVAVGECHLFNLAVHPDWQRRGLGRRLLRHLLAWAVERQADTAFLEVRASNAGARALYAAEGFCEIGIRRGYYPAPGGREDAVTMACTLLYAPADPRSAWNPPDTA